MLRARLLFLFVLAVSAPAFAQNASKKPLDAATYDIWKSVRNLTLSNNGKWAMYTLALQDGDATVEIKATDGSKSYTIERASPAVFSEDSRFVVATIVPKSEDVKKAKRAKTKPEDMPKNGLTILNLETGQRTDMERIASFGIAPHDCGWIVYKPEPPKAAPKSEAKPEERKPEEKKPGVKPDHKAGDLYVLRNLASGKEEKLESVAATIWSKDGTVLAYSVSTANGAGDGVVVEDVKRGTRRPVVTAIGKYSKLTICDTTKDLAFATDKDDYQAKKPAISIYVYRSVDGKLTKVDTSTLTAGFVPSENGRLQFSEKGTRLIFGVAPKPVEEKKDDTPDDEKVSVDVWNWQDPQMMPQQLLQAASERNRTYDAIYDTSTGTVVQIENPHLRTVTIGAKGDGDTALGSSNEPYMKESSWGDGRFDYYTVDLLNGKATPILKAFAGSVSLSPAGRYAYGYDLVAKDFLCIDLHTGKRVSLSKGIPEPVYDEENDVPALADAYGAAGWTANDAGVLIYDRYDVWLVDPTGTAKPVNLTRGIGRATSTDLRLERLDREEESVDLSKPVLFGAFNERSKQAGFYKLSKGELTKLFMVDKGFGPGPALTPIPAIVKARDAEEYAYQQMDVKVYADAWLADADLKNPRKISDANPQQKDYNWCTAELVSWTGNDGQPLQGILYKPENFDSSKKYPMITYYYEKLSDSLHQYYSPAPSASTINISMYCSNGYIVFVPDIPYKVGYPGESAMSAIMPGVQSILARGYIDPKRLGLQGQSWGGYQTGYLVTQTNMFAAACAGAPVSDMISAYGGIRWGSGVSREGQYEHGQSRIGGSLWADPLKYIENSPIFYVDKIHTPLLIMSNDKDGAVPWYQGIEYFSALRRLSKPAWLVSYNDEDHNIVQRKNRKDWSIRMQQFFDHYLKGAPMPVWMAEGIPATMKGKTYGFDLVPGTEKK
ncbi:MAG TPA: prolyl oligopeptidase family serine peptidase [Fimbriimonadaceae bacterium]|nr:prolyl oligopeptidase family serine peptidase [Fimbriimonadaceae bacterium]